jgi:diguanylate cyclase (GGDEF)-like protein
MSAPPHPIDEAERLAVLHALAVLDTAPEAEFEAFARIARSLFDAPFAAVAFLDAGREWRHAEAGALALPPGRELPRAAALSALVTDGETLVVPDASKTPRLRDHPLVAGAPGIRFLALAPLLAPGGHVVGALVVCDDKPRLCPAGAADAFASVAEAARTALERRAELLRLRSQAEADPLTGLPDRARFNALLGDALKPFTTGRRGGDAYAGGLALLSLDIDRFRQFNGSFGHAGGDALLREVAARLTSTLRRDDVAARLGGDEFAVLLRGAERREDAMAAARRIQSALARSFRLNGTPLSLTAAMGFALAPRDAVEPDALSALAEAAMQEARRAGPGSVRAAVQPGAARPALRGRTQVEAMLRDALLPAGHEPFVLHYQPVVRGADGGLTGFEALVRWPQPDGSLLPPGSFIPVAETAGLITLLDRWVMRQACSHARGWSRPLAIASNLSPANFMAADTLAAVRETLSATGLPAERLKLEITETVLIGDPERARETLAELRRWGVRIALDDFGAGHASLATLRDVPLDEIKIDRALVQDLPASTSSRAFLRAILDMAAALGIETLAEGVETVEQRDILAEAGVGAMQGWLFGAAVPADQVGALIGPERVVAAQ